MERTGRRVRQIRMTNQRLLRAGPGISGRPGAALLATALATCRHTGRHTGRMRIGDVSSGGHHHGHCRRAAAAPQVGCASVNQATAVSIQQTMRAVDPTTPRTVGTAYRQSPEVRALFGQLCAAVTHPAAATLMHCPLDIGTTYYGTFYDGSRSLATFSYAASGCERVSVTAAGKTMDTMVVGQAAAAAPHLSADLDALVGTKPGVTQPQGAAAQAPPVRAPSARAPSTRAARWTPRREGRGSGPRAHGRRSGPGRQGRLPDSSRSNSPSLTPRTNASHSASVK